MAEDDDNPKGNNPKRLQPSDPDWMRRAVEKIEGKGSGQDQGGGRASQDNTGNENRLKGLDKERSVPSTTKPVLTPGGPGMAGGSATAQRPNFQKMAQDAVDKHRANRPKSANEALKSNSAITPATPAPTAPKGGSGKIVRGNSQRPGPPPAPGSGKIVRSKGNQSPGPSGSGKITKGQNPSTPKGPKNDKGQGGPEGPDQ